MDNLITEEFIKMGELIRPRIWTIRQRIKELAFFLVNFPDSDRAPDRRREKEELEEELKSYER